MKMMQDTKGWGSRGPGLFSARSSIGRTLVFHAKKWSSILHRANLFLMDNI